jgi:hypothetical protein
MKKKATAPKNYIGEWYGARLYPTVKCTSRPVTHFTSELCPFLSASTGTDRQCVKTENSKGVCTITTTAGSTRDWMVCPFRSLDDNLLKAAISRIFGTPKDKISAHPVTRLDSPAFVASVRKQQKNGKQVFVYFQQKLGGEINVSASSQTPELSFDLTLIPIAFRDETLLVRRYGLYEVQTMDFHGSYAHAVKAVRSALDLHSESFAATIQANTDWLGRGIEGPNIANVFKRTFYQILLKFGLAGHGDCAGVVLALPSSVWESWSPHLAAPRLLNSGGIHTLAGDKDRDAKSWIIVFENDNRHPGPIEPLVIAKTIRASVPALLKAAYRDVPELIASRSIETVRSQILSRISQYYKKVEYDT